MAFLTIQPTPGLSTRRRRKANRLGPACCSVPTSYESLMTSAGFSDIETLDLTEAYRDTQLRWIAATQKREEAIRSVMGDEWYDDRVKNRFRTLAAIDDGLLSRYLYSAARPG